MAYIANTDQDIETMLDKIGLDSVDQLFDVIPEEYRFRRLLAVPPALGELELTQHVAETLDRNQGGDRRTCFLGGGSYDHFIPAVVDQLAHLPHPSPDTRLIAHGPTHARQIPTATPRDLQSFHDD